MTLFRFPMDGYALRTADENDMPYVMGCMKESILLSVPEDEAGLSDLWMDDILSVTSIAIGGNMMRSEMFVLCDEDNNRTGILWMGVSRDQFTCEGTGYLLGLFVNEELRRRGIGRALVGCAEEWCAANDLFSLTLNVGSSNSHAKSFYEHLGFGDRSAVMRRRLR
jgi:ribosomal protein S18 acetylase RimI-like enzyme